MKKISTAAWLAAGMIGCQSTESLYRPGPAFWDSIAGCPVVEDGLLAGADIFIAFKEPPNRFALDDFHYLSRQDYMYGPRFVGEPIEGELFINSYGGLTPIRAEGSRYDAIDLLAGPNQGVFMYIRDTGAPSIRLDTRLLLQHVPLPLFSGGLIFGSTIRREQPVSDDIEAIRSLVGVQAEASSRLDYRGALLRAIELMEGFEGPRVIMLSTSHRVQPSPEAEPERAERISASDRQAIREALRATETILIVLQVIENDFLMEYDVDADLQQLACESGGFLMPTPEHPGEYHDIGWLKMPEYGLSFALVRHGRLRVRWSPESFEGTLEGGIARWAGDEFGWIHSLLALPLKLPR